MHNNILTKRKVKIDRLKLIYDTILSSNIGMFLVGGVLVYVLKNSISHTLLMTWFGGLILTVCFNLYTKYYFLNCDKKQKYPVSKLENNFLLGVLLSGLLWGSAGYFLYPVEISDQTFLELTVAGIVAASIAVISVSIRAIFLFMPLCIIPLLIKILTSGTHNGYALTFIIFVYLIISIINGKKYNARLKAQLNLKYKSSINEQKLKTSEENYKLLYENSTDAMVLFADYQFKTANKAAVKLYGYETLEELLKVPAFTTSPKYQPDGIESFAKAQKISKILKKDKFCRIQWTYKRKTGEHRPADVTLTVIPFEGKTAIFCIIRDIYDAKKLENELRQAKKDAEASNKAKSEFLANMSHEIRTPMNGVIGINNLMLQYPLHEAQKLRALAIKSSADSMMTIINDILDFSKIEAGKLYIENTDFNLHSFINDFTSSIINRIHLKKLKFSCLIDEELNNWYHGSANRIRQIIANMIDNAIKFTSTGTITLHCQKIHQDKHTTSIQFNISDTGIGIPQEKQNEIFNRFIQADGSTTRKFGGTGLGLSICKQLVELMDGEIGLKSEENKGAHFWFTLTLKNSKNPQVTTVQSSTPPKLYKVTDGCILVADDNPINQMVVKGMLEIFGLCVDVVEDGSQAIEALKNKHYDLVLMDCHMPVLDGYAASTKIRQLATGTTKNTVPIIAVTASAMQGDKEKCLTAGMDDYLSKPIELEVLQQKLQQWLPKQKEHSTINSKTNKPDKNTMHNTADTSTQEDFNQIALFDYQDLYQRLSGKTTIITKIMAKSQEDLTAIATTVQQHVLANNIHEVQLSSHKLKGAAATIGCFRLSAYAKAMEDAAKNKKLTKIKECLIELELCCSQSVQALNAKREEINQ